MTNKPPAAEAGELKGHMKTEFVIVIEADNLRAYEAYRKGLADLDLIWPQLMAHAEAVDGPRNAEIDRVIKEEMEGFLEYSKACDEFMEAIKKWKSSTSMFRGPKPTQPWPPAPLLPSYGQDRDALRRAYESIRNELKHMADVAGAALGPYRMTEHQVSEMVAWEDGSRIESIKRDLQKWRP